MLKKYLRVGTVRNYSSQAGIELPRGESSRRGRRGYNSEEVASEIRGTIESGAKSVADVVRGTHYSPPTIRKYAEGAGIELQKREIFFVRGNYEKDERSDEEIAEEIRELLKSGEKSLERLCKDSKIGSARLMKLVRPDNQDIELPEDLIPWRTRPKLDQYVDMDEPPSLEEIGEEVGLTRERARQYYRDSGQTKTFQEKRRRNLENTKKSNIREKLGKVLGVLNEMLSIHAREEGWAYERAVEYTQRYPRWNKFGNYSLIDFVRLFEKYDIAKRQGQKLSLQELSEGTKWTQQEIGGILARVDVEPMHGKQDRHITPKHKKEAIRRAVKLRMSAVDVGSFLGLPSHIVHSSWGLWNLNEQRPEIGEGREEYGSRDKFFASEVYELGDLCGFDSEEIAEGLGVGKKSVGRVLRDREKIEAEIISDLRILYDDETIDTPYRRDF